MARHYSPVLDKNRRAAGKRVQGVSRFAFAEISSDRLVQRIREQFTTFDHLPEKGKDLHLFKERILLAQQLCDRLRALAEVAYGEAYFQQPEACQQIIDVAEQIVFSQDDGVRATYQHKLESMPIIQIPPFIRRCIP